MEVADIDTGMRDTFKYCAICRHRFVIYCEAFVRRAYEADVELLKRRYESYEIFI